MTRKSTDVPGSIAGYYYQVLLGCYELTKLTDKTDCVGIEAGADVRVIKQSNKVSIEAKFHKEKMGLYNDDIKKTIYNFYINSSNDHELVFSTNVSMTKDYEEFLVDNWGKKEFINENIEFIKKSILRHSIEHYKKVEFENYKSELNSQGILLNQNIEYIECLERDIFEHRTKEYINFAPINTTIKYSEFVNKIKFKFGKQDKLTTIKQLREEIANNIRLYHLNNFELDINIVRDIIDALIYEFFITIAINAEKTNPKFDELEKVSVGDLHDCIENFESRINDNYKFRIINEILRNFEIEEEQFYQTIESEYDGLYKEKLKDRYRKISNKFQTYLRSEKNYNNLVNRYSIGKKFSWNSVLKVITHTTIISVFKECKEENVTFEMSERSIDNVYIGDVIDYSYKNLDYTSATAKGAIREFLSSTSYAKLKEGQVVVLSTPGLKNGNRPCDKRNEIKSEEFIWDCAVAQAEDYHKYFSYVNSIDYKCDGCIRCEENDEYINNRLEIFLKKDCSEV